MFACGSSLCFRGLAYIMKTVMLRGAKWEGVFFSSIKIGCGCNPPGRDFWASHTTGTDNSPLQLQSVNSHSLGGNAWTW